MYIYVYMYIIHNHTCIVVRGPEQLCLCAA